MSFISAGNLFNPSASGIRGSIRGAVPAVVAKTRTACEGVRAATSRLISAAREAFARVPPQRDMSHRPFDSRAPMSAGIQVTKRNLLHQLARLELNLQDTVKRLEETLSMPNQNPFDTDAETYAQIKALDKKCHDIRQKIGEINDRLDIWEKIPV